jgi:uncharacterized protein (DUF1501 family)
MSFNRRSFIKYASLAAAGNFVGLRPFGAMTGLAANSNDYKALVCVFLFGGNDSNNMLIPFDTRGYTNYAKIRQGLALAQNTLLPLAPASAFALNPNMTGLQAVFNSGKAAFVANVGTLVRPLTVPEYNNGQVATPSNLFSHADQQLEWQNSEQSGGVPTGWAGRIADSLTPVYNPNGRIPLVASVDGDTLFCDGSSSSPVAVVPGHVSTGQCSEGAACEGRRSAEKQIVTFVSGPTLSTQDDAIASRGDEFITTLGEALQSIASLKTVFPNSGLGSQLKQIAQIIQTRQALGVGRQIFFAGLGGFDTHSIQLPRQAGLLAALDSGITAFYQATEELGLADQITTFTMSDFSRALEPNSGGGTDHAWGGHQIVLGGAVKGGEIYGAYPTLALGGPDDIGSNGRWLPSTASVQYAATLASWFGLPPAELSTVFPLLGNFSKPTLGFL